MRNRKTLSLDFDGVVHPYTHGWEGIDVIRDEPPVAGAMEFIWNASKILVVNIFSSRSAAPEGRAAMQQYIRKYFTEWGLQRYDRVLIDTFLAEIQYPERKPHAFVTLDSRAMRFNGIWPEPWTLEQFQPWYIKDKKGPAT